MDLGPEVSSNVIVGDGVATSNVISLDGYRQRRELGTEMNRSPVVRDADELQDIAEKNKQNAERVRRERAKQNDKTKRSYRLPTK